MARVRTLLDLRAQALAAATALPAQDRGMLLALFGSAERILGLCDRIVAERRSVVRDFAPATAQTPADGLLGAQPA